MELFGFFLLHILPVLFVYVMQKYASQDGAEGDC